jgi:hypothetical protein
LNKAGQLPAWTITGPAAGVTISAGNSRVIAVDQEVTAYLSGLTIQSGSQENGAGLEVLGTANVTNCTFSGIVASSASAIEVSGGTLAVSHSTITGWFIGIHVVAGATATITSSTITGNSSAGVFIEGDSNHSVIGDGSGGSGAGNTITFNGQGVVVGQNLIDSSSQNSILGNSIYGRPGGLARRAGRGCP